MELSEPRGSKWDLFLVQDIIFPFPNVKTSPERVDG